MENETNLIMYTTEDGITKIQATFDNDTVWLSIDQMAELFQRDKSVIGKHVRNIFSEGELNKNSVWANFAYTAADGKTYQVDYYNLDVIISVGYRVKSLRGTQFRIWAMQILKEYMQKGFALDDNRLKELGGGNYFDELLARIRDIRSSEKVFWRNVDMYGYDGMWNKLQSRQYCEKVMPLFGVTSVEQLITMIMTHSVPREYSYPGLFIKIPSIPWQFKDNGIASLS